MKHVISQKYSHQTARMQGSVEERIVAVKTSISTTFKERNNKVSTGT